MSRPPHSTRSPPLGIKIIVVLGVIGSILSLFGGLGQLFSGSLVGLFGVVVIVLALVKLGILAGLWSLERWAWTAAMALYAIGALLDLVRFNVIGLIISVIILAYIYSQRHLFR